MAATPVFINKRSQAIGLAAELRFPDRVKRVDVRARGCERSIAPLGRTWDSFFLEGLQQRFVVRQPQGSDDDTL